MPGSVPIVEPVLAKESILVRRVAFIIMIILNLLSLPATVLAAEPAEGSIEGTVINQTADGSSVADVDISLFTYLNGNETDSTVTQTDAEGFFFFDGLLTDPAYDYQVLIDYQGADYYSDYLKFSDQETTLSPVIHVFDSTTTPEAILVDIAHVTVKVESGRLIIKEVYLFINGSDKAYIGLAVPGGEREVLKFSLPPDATEWQIGMGLMECCITRYQDGFSENMPLLPGDRQVSFSYSVDYNASTYIYSQDIYHPLLSYYFLVEGVSTQVSSDQLLQGEPQDMGDAVYTFLAGNEFMPGETIVAQISGLPRAGNQTVLIWIVIGLVLPATGVTFFFLRRRRRLQPVIVSESLEKQQEKLLTEIAELDDDFEAQRIPEDAYNKERAAKKAVLVALLEKSTEERDS